MQFFIESYHRNNKILLSLIGQWPYQTVKSRRLIFFILIFLSGTQIIAKFCALWEAIGDIDILIENLSPLMIDIMAAAKIINNFLNLEKMKELLDRMQKHVQLQSNFQILQKYAENSRKFTLVYMTALYSALIVFVLMPLQPILFPTSNVTNRPLLHNVEYYVDIEKYYIPILLHGYITVIICVTIVIAVDTMFVVLVQHACGLFSIVGYQLEHIITDKTLVNSGSNLHIKEDLPYQYIKQCINDHNEAVRFANLIESSYSVCTLFQAGFIMVSLSITGVQVVTSMGSLHNLLRQVALSCGQLLHLFFESLHAQNLINHSGDLHTNLINAEWYQMSFRTKKLLSIMIIRAQLPSVLTAGNIFVLSMESFCAIMRTSLSYFTVLRTMQ